MEGLFFNVDAGYVEAVTRGYKNQLLSSAQYSSMAQCDTLDDLKLQLSATEYSAVLQDTTSVSTSQLEQRLTQQLVTRFQYLRAQASYPLSQFMDYMTYGYMIDNVALMITGTIHGRNKDEILGRCHPLGWFDTLPTLSIAADLDSLYEAVLVDTPLAKYFDGISVDDLDDLNIEIVRNCLYKAYLDDFAQWCAKELGNPSDEIMARLLTFEADKRSINICINSLDTELTAEEKIKMLPNIGLLSEESMKLHMAQSSELENLKMAIQSIGAYQFFNDKSLEDNMYAWEMGLNRDAFTQQFTYSTIWAWVKSMEQEVRNVTWIAECIAQNQRGKIGNYVSVY